MMEWAESGLVANALLLAILVWLVFRRHLQRLGYRIKRAIRNLKQGE